ncbi:MAG: hypothetical protein C4554_11070 [Dethiobacter sp.]|nr:MAG: hypothetical protein C4554_11070 [Dethiobacter sp.]
MSCSSIKQQFEQLKNQGNLTIDKVVNLYNDLQGSLDAHRLELRGLQKNGDRHQIEHLQKHIEDGETLLSEFKNMTVH